MACCHLDDQLACLAAGISVVGERGVPASIALRQLTPLEYCVADEEPVAARIEREETDVAARVAREVDQQELSVAEEIDRTS